MATTQIPPRVTESNVEAWAHCSNPRCEGNGQQQVPGVRVLSEYTIGSRGGDGIFVQLVENSSEYVRFADDADSACEVCGGPREISEQRRIVHPITMGFPQDALLGTPAYDPSIVNTPADQRAAEEMTEMRKAMLEMQEKIAKLSEGKAA